MFKVLTLNVAMSTIFLHLSKLGLGLGLCSVSDFSNTMSRPQQNTPLVCPHDGRCGLN